MDPLHTFLTTASANAILLAGIVYIFRAYDSGNKARFTAVEKAIEECEKDRHSLRESFVNHLIEEKKHNL